MKQILLLSTFLLASISFSGAQLSHRSNPEIQWDAKIKSVLQGNGVFLSPDEKFLVASTSLGYISAFGSRDGSEVFQYVYEPNSTDIEFITSGSGIAFSTDYMVFALFINENSDAPLT